MIVDSILIGLVSFAKLIVGLIPDWTPPSALTSLHDEAAALGVYASAVSYWVPLDTAATLIAAILALYLTVAGARLTLWIYSKVPGVGK